MLERMGCAVCCADVQVGAFRCNVLLFCVLLSCVGFVQAHFGVEKYEKLREGGNVASSQSSSGETITFKDASMDDRYKLQLFRDQRNWWISLCNLVLWITCWRVQRLMRRHQQDRDSGTSGGSGPSGNSSSGGGSGPGSGGIFFEKHLYLHINVL